MERKQYSEYRPKLLIEPPKAYYAVCCIVWLLMIILVYSLAYLCDLYYLDSLYSYVLLAIIAGVFGTYEVYRISRERALIHDNGKLELFYGKYFHKVVSIAEIKQITFRCPWNIYGINFIVLVLELQNGKKIKFQVKETKEFLAELKKHNPDIIIPELPEI